MKVRSILNHRFGFIALMVMVFLLFSAFTRLILLFYTWQQIELSLDIPAALLIGLLYDFVTATYVVIPIFILLVLVSNRLLKAKWFRSTLVICMFLEISFLLFTSLAEGFFWEEFNTRFNFIAVDYLVYTTEVLGNIKESYPLQQIIPAIIIGALSLTYLLRPAIRQSSVSKMRWPNRLKWAMGFMLAPLLAYFTINTEQKQFSKNAYVNELAGNGLYELFAAYRNNELDYSKFYKTIDKQKAFIKVKTMLKTPEATYTSTDSFSLERKINNPGPEKKLNVVLISVESLSASFMQAFGNTMGITPHLDSLSRHGLLFTNLYATGTRTVRGLEALSLAIPPTPGQSVIRRPHNENMFTLATVFNAHGYESKFIYGGYGYFDNMNYFFSENHYETIDRLNVPKEQIHFENIWGIADEDLFWLAEKEILKTTTLNKPFFVHIMTTSNHRPFTYPNGRIDIPSHTGRSGAVKYTDFAINAFIKKCSTFSWYDNTLFVIIADHCASSAGKTYLPPDKYKIPMIIFSPKHIEPGVVNLLMSQIDVAPTLLGLLNFSYTSKFLGYDIFKTTHEQRRVFLSTYQLLGYMKDNDLVILEPHQKVSYSNNPEFIEESIAWYETTHFLLKYGSLHN